MVPQKLEKLKKLKIAVFPAPSDLKKMKKLKIARFCGLLCSCTSPGHGSPEAEKAEKAENSGVFRPLGSEKAEKAENTGFWPFSLFLPAASVVFSL